MNSPRLDVKQLPNVQDAFRPKPDLISCAGVTGGVGIAHTTQMTGLSSHSHTTWLPMVVLIVFNYLTLCACTCTPPHPPPPSPPSSPGCVRRGRWCCTVTSMATAASTMSSSTAAMMWRTQPPGSAPECSLACCPRMPQTSSPTRAPDLWCRRARYRVCVCICIHVLCVPS